MHRGGGKITGSHTTITSASALVVDAGQRMKKVKKIVLGIIRRRRSKERRLKFKEVRAGWNVVVYDKTCFQELYFYCDLEDRGSVKADIEAAFLS